ncbi:OmpA family protein [Joostella sp. CR20]|uniref:OmpA family protein n=1 Tax=Joostella sp. CR20 TaxID=2804312 RepID=UPI00313AED9F
MNIKLLIGIAFLGTFQLFSQELSIKVNGGISGIDYQSQIGDGEKEAGFGFGVGYTHFFNEHWAILGGLEANLNRNTFELFNGNVITTFETDDQASAFEYRVAPTNYKEDQYFWSFAIPIMLQYRTPISATTGIYLGAGVKSMIPAKQHVDASAEQLSATGYYPDLNLEFDDLSAHGFGDVNNWEEDTKVSLRPSFLASVEGGLFFKLKKKTTLYTGLYFDYGMSDMQQNNATKNLVSYSESGTNGIKANGVMSTEKIIDKNRYFALGFQVKLGFALGKEETVVIVEEEKVIEEPEEILPIEVEEEEIVIVEETPIFSDEEIAYIQKPITFGVINKTTIPNVLDERIDTIAELLKRDDSIPITIIGHTCDLGSEAVNMRVGMQRAEAVASRLEENGISRSRMEVISKGESEPLVPNTSNENRMKNRRVSIIVYVDDL